MLASGIKTDVFTLTSIEFAAREKTFILDRTCSVRCNVFMYRVYNEKCVYILQDGYSAS